MLPRCGHLLQVLEVHGSCGQSSRRSSQRSARQNFLIGFVECESDCSIQRISDSSTCSGFSPTGEASTVGFAMRWPGA